MKTILFRFIGRVSDLIDVHPLLALFVGGALLTVFLSALFRSRPAGSESGGSLIWLLYRQSVRLVWAVALVGIVAGSMSFLRVYLRQNLAAFQRTHGRVTEANLHAVETIWGAAQEQVDLQTGLYYEEEVTERFESEDVTKPAVLRKKTVRHEVPANPFLAATHEVTLRQNPRKKGSALYGGFETVCHFRWKLINPAERDLSSTLKFPLPGANGMYNDLTAVLNGKDILPQMQLREGHLLLNRPWKAGETLELTISFTSRGMSSWYFQIREPREIRDFTLTLTLPDVPQSRLNNPEGCMSPTGVKPTGDKLGSVLTYRLDHAISNKGMGVALPAPPQPGSTTSQMLIESERAWLLIFAMLLVGLVLGAVEKQPDLFAGDTDGLPAGRNAKVTSWAVLLSIFFGAATASAYALLADLSDLLLGFWGTAALVIVPMFLLLGWLLKRLAPVRWGGVLALQFIIYGLTYPLLAGLDPDRQSLYFNLCALAFLAFVALQLGFARTPSGTMPVAEPLPSGAAAT